MIPFWKKTDKGGKKTPPKPAIPHTAQPFPCSGCLRMEPAG